MRCVPTLISAGLMLAATRFLPSNLTAHLMTVIQKSSAATR
jgi:hypothetical protein